MRLGDVAEVDLGAQDERTAVRWNGKPTTGMGVVKQTRASTLQVAETVINALPELEKALPQGMKIDVAYNSATFIENSINEVAETLLIAFGLVVLVIIAFLKSFRATLIPTFAIPISIVGTFAVSYFLGYTVNILTLLALVLAIGLVVDDAIVMLENIYRHMEMGKSRMQAAIDGAREIGFAVLATTISLVAVFVPLAFLSGNIGRLFNEFGVTVAVSVLISGFVALTLTPMLSSRMLKPLHHTGASWASRSFDKFFDWLERAYGKIVRGALRQRGWVMATAVLLIALSAAIFKFLPSELVPTEDRGTGFGIVIAPEGATLE